MYYVYIINRRKVTIKNLEGFKDFGTKTKFKVLGISIEGRSFAKEKKLNYLEAELIFGKWHSKYKHYGAYTKFSKTKSQPFNAE
tara:strand:- start:785 stop:1036 length:252 start_codon:yes stop_codon:yes gene_type:complete